MADSRTRLWLRLIFILVLLAKSRLYFVLNLQGDELMIYVQQLVPLQGFIKAFFPFLNYIIGTMMYGSHMHSSSRYSLSRKLYFAMLREEEGMPQI